MRYVMFFAGFMGIAVFLAFSPSTSHAISFPSCSLSPQQDRIIVQFNPITKLWANEQYKMGGPFSASIPAGEYKITAMSFDDHLERSHQNQPNEQWFMILKNNNSTVAQTGSTNDLPDNADVRVDVVNISLVIPQSVTSIITFHTMYPNSNPNSIYPICAAFDRIHQPEPPTVDIKANGSDGPITIGFNSSATVSWTSSNASSCTASGAWSGSKSLSGSQSTGNLTGSKTYTITCTGSDGSDSDSVTINVQPPASPTVDIKANGSDGPVTIGFNSSSNLTWTSSDASSCTASGAWSGSKSLSGSQSTGNLTGSKTYVITCTGQGGSDSDSVTVTVQSQNLPTVDITATPSSIIQGDTSSLGWTSSNADSCFATNGWSGTKSLSGNQAVSPQNTATYTITCSNGAGQASDSVTITVSVPQSLPTVAISANPNQVAQGNPSVLTWTSANADTCTASGASDWNGSRNIFGNQVVSLFNTTTYTITCSNSTGQASDSVTVSVQSITPSADIKANGSDTSITISPNSSATISWTSSNAASCSISPTGWFGTSGSQSTSNLTNSITYTINCSGVTGGTASDSVTVNIQDNLPTVDISANPGFITQGNSTVLTWTSSNADSCFATNGWSGTKSLSGNQSTFLTQTTTYTITCYNNAGQATDSVTVSVQAITPTVDITAAPITINRGESTVLVWSSANADSCFATNGWSGSKSRSGSEVTAPQFDTTYTVTCAKGGQSVSDSVTVFVNANQPPITGTFNVACSVSSPTITLGDSVSFVAGYAGGVAPVTFQWSGDVTGFTQSRVTNFSTTGTKFATVTVTDAQGRNNSANCSVQVVPATVVSAAPPQPPTVITATTNTQPTSCCCCNGVPTQIQYDSNGNPITVASDTQDRSMLASLFTTQSGNPSTLLYMLLFLLIVLAIIAMVRYLFVDKPVRRYEYGYRQEQYPYERKGYGYQNGNSNGYANGYASDDERFEPKKRQPQPYNENERFEPKRNGYPRPTYTEQSR
ncbi:MAG: hypothetical protein Q8O83_00420 [bacterium]|nr:hypothetical protein [bacterium]